MENHDKLVEFLKGAKVVINCTLYKFNTAIMEAALEAKVNYIDLGGGSVSEVQTGGDEFFNDPCRNCECRPN